MPYEVQHQAKIPEGTLLKATLVGLESKHFPARNPGEEGFTKLNWEWEITEEGDYKGMKVKGECSAFLSDHPENRFRNWAEALLQRPLDLGQVLDESDLVGLPALITVWYQPDRKDPSKTWRRVQDVLSLDAGGFNSSDAPPF
jgi:hypothetical protein